MNCTTLKIYAIPCFTGMRQAEILGLANELKK
jgi:hypothetical protein